MQVLTAQGGACEVEDIPALFMVGRAPLRAHRRLPPNGTYCWLGGRDSVLRSWRRCFSLRMECTAFRKSFLLSGELQIGQKHKNFKSNILEKGLVFDVVSLQFTCFEYTCTVFERKKKKKITPAAQLERSLWSSFRFRSCVNYLTCCRTLRV